MTKRLSALVVAHDEEGQIRDCLAGLTFADEVVVVLDRCGDGTKDIALQAGARIVEGAWPIEGDRRNAGLDACTGDWVLEVDADERVPDALAREIRAAIEPVSDGYFLIPFDNYIGETLVRHGWGAAWGVGAAPRLSAKGAKRWGRQRVHPSLDLKGPKRTLRERMVHRVDEGISDMLRRLDRYTSARAADLRDGAEADVGFARNVRRLFSRFWKCYVARKGYREGKWGFLIALMAGLYPILSYLKANLEDR